MIKILPEHVKLLKRLEWQWQDCESGAPAVDCKRPYGNSGDPEDDIREILGWREGKTPDERIEQEERAFDLHHEMLGVIVQILKEYIENHG